MTYCIVSTAEELEAAVSAGHTDIEVYCDSGQIIDIHNTGWSKIIVAGSTRVAVYGASVVFAFHTSIVYAHDEAGAYAHDDSVVYAYDKSCVDAYGRAEVWQESPEATVRIHGDLARVWHFTRAA